MPTLKKSKRAQIKDLMLQLKNLKKEEQTKPKSSRWQKIIKIRSEISGIETKEAIQRTKDQ